jgi:hypothetical protein
MDLQLSQLASDLAGDPGGEAAREAYSKQIMSFLESDSD